jgi:hypothetical protein
MKMLNCAVVVTSGAVVAVGLLAGCGRDDSVQTPTDSSTLTTQVNTSPMTTGSPTSSAMTP